jgi:hypothetical protein
MSKMELIIEKSMSETFKKFYIKTGFFVIFLLLLVLVVNAGNDSQVKGNNRYKQGNFVDKSIPYTLPWDVIAGREALKNREEIMSSLQHILFILSASE